MATFIQIFSFFSQITSTQQGSKFCFNLDSYQRLAMSQLLSNQIPGAQIPALFLYLNCFPQGTVGHFQKLFIFFFTNLKFCVQVLKVCFRSRPNLPHVKELSNTINLWTKSTIRNRFWWHNLIDVFLPIDKSYYSSRSVLSCNVSVEDW